MASVVTRLSDVIVPEVYEKYLTQESITKTGFVRSNIVTVDPRISAFLSGGGDQVNMPFWKRLSGDAQAIQENYTITTGKLQTAKMIARRLLFAGAWSAEELAAALSGEDPMGAVQSMVDQWWEEQFQKVLFNSVIGVIGDNIDNDSGDLVLDITTSGTPAAGNKVSASAIIDAYALLGDAADFVGIGMHSTPYYTLSKLNLIDFSPSSAQNIGFGTFMGLTVVVTDQLIPDTDGSNKVYWNVLFKSGAFGFGESSQGITPVELSRNAAKSEDALFTRRQFCLHPHGFAWVEGSVNEEMPTLREVREPGNWNRVMEAKHSGFVVLKTNG